MYYVPDENIRWKSNIKQKDNNSMLTERDINKYFRVYQGINFGVKIMYILEVL